MEAKDTAAVDIKAKQRERMLEAAKRYAASDRSDPFAMARVIAHLKNGIASYSRPGNSEYSITSGSPAFYDADVGSETRRYVHDGREVVYAVPTYSNLARP
jgi:hypothetical protein